MEDCLFCKIAKKEIPAKIIYENEEILAFQDQNPIAPLHLLVIPQKHIPTINHIETEDKELLWNLFSAAKKIAQDQGVAETGYRLIFNVGRDAGQTIDHLHLHLLGGKILSWE